MSSVVGDVRAAANQIEKEKEGIRKSSTQQSQSTYGASRSIVPYSIKASLLEHEKLTLSLYQKSDLIGHTGIVLKLDGTPKFTIDYFAAGEEKEEEDKGDAFETGSYASSSFSKSSRNVSKKSCASFNKASGVGTDQWDGGNMEPLCDLATISLCSKEREVVKLIDGLLKLNNVGNNNCRDWCVKAGDFIAKKFQVSEKNMEKFKSKLNPIIADDSRRIVPNKKQVEIKEITKL